MYSPKIHEKFVPVLYRLGRRRQVAMTRLVEEALHDYLTRQGLDEEVLAESLRRRIASPSGRHLLR